MEFHLLELQYIDLLRPYLQLCESRICDCTVGCTFMWRDLVKTYFAIEDETLYIRVDDLDGKTAFGCPLGGELKKGIEKILEYCRENDIPPALCMVPEHLIEEVKELTGGTVTTDRAWYDYLYSSEDMKTFAGRKYSGQRNHINKFLKENEVWSFEAITPENIDSVKTFLQIFIDADRGEFINLTEGNLKAMEILDNFGAYGLFGGMLKAGENIVGFAIGEVLGDTLFVHVEKSLREVEGAYQMLVREFAKAYACDGVHFVNREEDDGNEGLRTSKLSYHPVKLLEKYLVTV